MVCGTIYISISMNHWSDVVFRTSMLIQSSLALFLNLVSRSFDTMIFLTTRGFVN